MLVWSWWALWSFILLLCSGLVGGVDKDYPDITNHRTNALPSHYCHNGCSGHGRCGNDDNCYCAAEYDTKLVPDCSWKVCAFGAAWADKAYGVDTAHSQKECSGAGTCNRYTGICECFNGYTGKACERMDCPNKCSGHGECYTMSTLQNLYNFSHSAADVYNIWDANKVMGCACDYGYTGGACEMKMCPKGHDPLVEQNATHRIVIRTWSEQGALSGKFKLYFMGQSFEFNSVVASFTGARCAERFAKLPGVKSVTCTHNATDYAHGGAAYFVDFTGWPTNPKENNIFTHNGKPGVEAFHCDTSNVTNADGYDVHCNVFEGAQNANNDYVAKYDYCSNRGICDLNTGECACYQNFYGAACEVYVPQEIYADYVDVMTISANDTDFTDTVLRIQDTIRGDAGDWSSFYIETNEETYNTERNAAFNITSDGDIIHSRGGWSIQGRRDGLTGVTIHTGGLRVHDGITIDSEGLEVVNKGVAGDLRFSGQGKVSGGMTFGETLLVDSPGLTVMGGLTVNEGMVVPDCLTPVPGRESVFGVGCLNPKGIYVAAGGADFHHGVWLRSGMNVTGGLRMGEWRTDGVTVETGGLEIYEGGMTVWYKGLVVDRDSRVEDGLTVTGGVTVNGNAGMSVVEGADVTGGVEVANKVYVQSDGVSAAGGVTVYDGGMVNYAEKLDIRSGGLRLDVPAGAMTVREGIKISRDPGVPSADGLRVTLGGLTIAGGAMTVTGGVTVASDGLVSSTDGAVDIVGGLAVTGGISHTDHPLLMESSRMSITGGLTVHDVGMRVTEQGLSVAADGIVVSDTGVDFTITQGLRVQAGGLTVASSGGLEVTLGTVTHHGPAAFTAAGGATVIGGAVFRDQGMDHFFNIHGTVDVDDGGVRAAQRGLNVSAGGIRVQLNGLSVNLDRATLHPTEAYNPETSTINTLDSSTTVNLGGGITVGGGVSIGSLGLDIASAVGSWGNRHFIHGGMSAAAGVDVTGGGMKIEQGSNAVPLADAVIEDGVTVAARVAVTGVQGVMVEGQVTITSGGLHILTNSQDEANTRLNTGTYWRGGSTLGGKLTVHSGGMFFRGGDTRSDITEDGGVVTDGGLHVMGGGLLVNSATISTIPWSEVHSGQEHEKRDPYAVSVTGGVTVEDTGLTINNARGPEAFGDDDAPLHKEGIKYGLTISDTTDTAATGLRVTADGLSVNAHGITVETAGVSVVSGGMGVSSPVPISVQTGGLVVVGGFEAADTVVKITDGLSIVSDGMELKAGLEVREGGLVIEGGGDLANANEVGGAGAGTAVSITGPLDSKGTIVVSADGVQVDDGGVFVKEGTVTIQDSGIASLKGGLTITNTGLAVSTGGVTVEAGGLVIAGKDGGGQASGIGLDIDDSGGGLEIEDDLTIFHNTYSADSETVASDRRLKTSMESLEGQESLQKVRLLRGVFFHYNGSAAPPADTEQSGQEGQGGQGRRVGLLAQDVQVVLPEAVKVLGKDTPSPGYLGVKYLSLVPLLVEAVRALTDNVASVWDAISVSLAPPPPASTPVSQQRQRLLASIRELESLLAPQEQELSELEGVARALWQS